MNNGFSHLVRNSPDTHTFRALNSTNQFAKERQRIQRDSGKALRANCIGLSPGPRFSNWDAPFAKWFVDGKTNFAYNCVDRHLELCARHNKLAILWEGEPGDVRALSYQMLHYEVCRFANVLKSLGIQKGDRATIYMGMVPELAIAMLACARLEFCAYNVVFGGFSAEALRDRINDSKSQVLITADGRVSKRLSQLAAEEECRRRVGEYAIDRKACSSYTSGRAKQ